MTDNIIRVSTVAVCHDRRGFVLLKRGTACRDEHGRWDLVAGQLEYGSHAEENIRREIREELGTEPLELSFLGYRDVFRAAGADSPHYVSLDFAAQVEHDAVRNAEPGKHDDLGWFYFGYMPDRDSWHSQLAEFLTRYRTQIRRAFADTELAAAVSTTVIQNELISRLWDLAGCHHRDEDVPEALSSRIAELQAMLALAGPGKLPACMKSTVNASRPRDKHRPRCCRST